LLPTFFQVFFNTAKLYVRTGSGTGGLPNNVTPGGERDGLASNQRT